MLGGVNVQWIALPQPLPRTTPPAPGEVVAAPAPPVDAVILSSPTPSRPPHDVSLPVAAAPLGGPLGQVLASESERLNEFFRVGGGSTEGLRAPELAEGLLAARQAGATFLSHGVHPDALDPVEAYETMLSPHPQLGTVYLGLEGIQMVACNRENLRGGIALFDPFAATHREVLRHGRFDSYAMQCALDRIAGQQAPAAIQAHAELLVALYDCVKASGRHGGSSEDTAHAMTRLYDWLSPRLGDLSDERVRDVMAWAARGGADEAGKAGEHGCALDGTAYAEFAGVMRAVGNAEAARLALAAVDASERGPREDRLAALQSLCALYAASPRGEDAVGAWVAVMDAWHGDEPLRAVTDRFVALHRTLAARGLADHARDCFQGLERHWRGSGEASPERSYMTFIDHVHRTGGADLGALAREPADRAATVERQADAVVVGGVRLPIRAA